MVNTTGETLLVNFQQELSNKEEIDLEFATKHSLLLSNTLHPQKKSRISIWHSPNGLAFYQIDFILTPQ